MTRSDDIPAIFDRRCELHHFSVEALREAISAFVSDGTRPHLKARANGCCAHPELRIKREGDVLHSRKLRSFDEPPLG